MRYLNKVLAKREPKEKKGIITPSKPQKASSPYKPAKANKASKAHKARKIKPGVATADNAANTNFVHVRALMDTFGKDMRVANPFDVADASWIKFMKEFAPKLLVALLWDTKHVTDAKDRVALTRLFRQRIRT